MLVYRADKGRAFQGIVRICSSGTSAVASLNLTSSHAVLHTVCSRIRQDNNFGLFNKLIDRFTARTRCFEKPMPETYVVRGIGLLIDVELSDNQITRYFS